MNAVKRCLTLFAVTLVVGACGSDQSEPDAGKDLHIRATPAAVWTRHNSAPATFLVDAIDNLGGAASGSWSVGAITGPMTVTLDTSYQSTTTGPLGLAARFVVTPTAAGDGSVVINGTGGPITVPVRIAPDTGSFAVTVSTSTPALGEAVTVTAPAGIVFTGATTFRFFDGPQAADTSNGGYTFPAVGGLGADSSTVTFVPGPGATGVMRISGIASRSTPSLQTTARTTATVTAVASVDTANLPITLSNAAPTVVDTVVATIAAPYRFTAASAINIGVTPTSGGATAIPAGFSADSQQISFIVPPGASGKVHFDRVVWQNAPSGGYAGRSAATLTSAPPPPLNATFSNLTPAVNTAITVTMPAGFKFRPTSTIRFGTTGTPWIITSRSADSLSVTAIPEAGGSGTPNISAVQLASAPAFSLTLGATSTVTVPAAPDLGDDDATAGPTGGFTVNLTTPNTATGIWDQATFEAPDWLGFGACCGQQDVAITFTHAGSYTVRVGWRSGAPAIDIDAAIVLGDLSDLYATALTGSNPETMTFIVADGETVFLSMGLYSGPLAPVLKYEVTLNP